MIGEVSVAMNRTSNRSGLWLPSIEWIPSVAVDGSCHAGRRRCWRALRLTIEAANLCGSAPAIWTLIHATACSTSRSEVPQGHVKWTKGVHRKPRQLTSICRTGARLCALHSKRRPTTVGAVRGNGAADDTPTRSRKTQSVKGLLNCAMEHHNHLLLAAPRSRIRLRRPEARLYRQDF